MNSFIGSKHQLKDKQIKRIILRVKSSSTGSGDGSYTDNSSNENRDEKKVKNNTNLLSFIY